MGSTRWGFREDVRTEDTNWEVVSVEMSKARG